MSENVDVSRKHGPFDTRWPSGHTNGSRAPQGRLSAAAVAEALDWTSFSARHFGGRRRHDMETVAAYAAYRNGREWNGGKPRQSQGGRHG